MGPRRHSAFRRELMLLTVRHERLRRELDDARFAAELFRLAAEEERRRRSAGDGAERRDGEHDPAGGGRRVGRQA